MRPAAGVRPGALLPCERTRPRFHSRKALTRGYGLTPRLIPAPFRHIAPNCGWVAQTPGLQPT